MTNPNTDTYHRLQEQQSDLIREVSRRYFQAYPETSEQVNFARRKKFRDDLKEYLQVMMNALAVGEPRLFADYSTWLRAYSESRDIPTSYAVEIFELIRESARPSVGAACRDALERVIDAGIEALNRDVAARSQTRSAHEPLPQCGLYTAAVIAGQDLQAGKIVDDCFASGISMTDVYVCLFQPSMYEVGRLWHSNRIGVAHEHIATSITQYLMVRAYANAEFAQPVDRRAVFSCVEGNQHSLGLRMVSDVFEISGWNVNYLGADLPTESLLSYLDESQPDLLGLSVSMPWQLVALQDQIDMLRAELGSRSPAIAIGGHVVNAIGGPPNGLAVESWFRDARSAAENLA